MDFVKRNLAFIAVVLGTILLLVGGVFLFTKSGSSESKISSDLLIGKDSFQSSPGASVTLVEFGDFQCPACGAYEPLVGQLLTEFDGKLNFVFRHFPLSQHANAKISSYAVEAARIQGKFMPMYKKIYETQGEWSASTDARSIFIGYAKDLGLNVKTFTTDIDSQVVKDKINTDSSDGVSVGINQTPTFFLNGVKLNLPPSYDAFKKSVQDAVDKVPNKQSDGENSIHIHFDLLAYLDGSSIDFTQAKYQESDSNPLNPDIHFHDGNGKVVHVHKSGVALSVLFDSLKIVFPKDVSGYVNGKKVDNILSYIPQDVDRILVGNGQSEMVSNDSCIYSLKCPERGTPPPEKCVGGLGTGCSD